MDARAGAVAGVAGLLADPTRAGILLALAQSGPHAVTELAATAGVSPSTASAHLTKLTSAQMVAPERVGRMRLYRVTGSDVVRALESLARLGSTASSNERQRRQPAQHDEVARTCYDHLAGRLGVGITDALLARRLIQKGEQGYRAAKSGGYGVTLRGRDFFRHLGVDLRPLRVASRSFAHPCIDRTERRPHLGGSLGAALAGRLEELGWVQRLPRTRALLISTRGHAGLRSRFGLDL